MVRPPCCDKGGVKKGPWTPEEDIILVTYIQEHGPGNWRAVPTNTGMHILHSSSLSFSLCVYIISKDLYVDISRVMKVRISQGIKMGLDFSLYTLCS